MKLEDMQHLLRHIDTLSNYDFELFYKLMLIRGMQREHPRKTDPRDRPPQATDYTTAPQNPPPGGS